MGKDNGKTNKKVKYKTASWYKKTLDKLFSQYVRLSNAINGYCVCVTCGKRLRWKGKGKIGTPEYEAGMQAGHFIQRGRLELRYDEKNVNCQCNFCNNKMFLAGNLGNYAMFMCETYGVELTNKFLAIEKANKPYKITPMWYKEKIAYYKAEVKDLELGLSLQEQIEPWEG